MTHVAWRQSGLPPSRVIGAGCNLDSERLCHVLDISLNTHKQAWVIGELSDNKGKIETGLRISFTSGGKVSMGGGMAWPEGVVSNQMLVALLLAAVTFCVF